MKNKIKFFTIIEPMIKHSKIKLILLIAFVFIFESFALHASSNRKPKWISNRPIDNQFYIGIGKSNKTANNDYIQAAKNNALADLISEISVQISSNSLLYQFEDNSGFKEKYEEEIQLKAKDEITDFEIVDTWENKDEYWVYYRLSKADYQRKKREMLEHAKNLSKDFYEKAQNAEKEYDINNALIYYVKSFDAIKNHLGEDLSVFTFDGKTLLDNAVYQSIQDIFSRIKIVPEKELYTIRALSSNNQAVNVKVKLKTDLETQNLANIPITFSFVDINNKASENVTSNIKGNATCLIASMAKKGRAQIIKAELNTDYYFGETSPDNILKLLFSERNSAPFGNINIVVQEIFAYLESEENVLGNSNSSKSITNFIKDELSETFFSFTDDKENADVYIKIFTTIKEGTKLDKLNLHTVFLDFSISVWSTKSNMEIYNDGFSDLKGMKSGSYQVAAQDAILKAKQKIKEDIIPSIRKINL